VELAPKWGSDAGATGETGRQLQSAVLPGDACAGGAPEG
jgi:hypothetical protein